MSRAFKSRPFLASLGLFGVLALLPACNVISQRAEGVLPTEPVAPPPFMRSGAAAEPAQPARPVRREAARRERLERPDGTRMDAPQAGTRRIRREDIEGEEPRSAGGGSSVAPVMGSGGVGIGGRF